MTLRWIGTILQTVWKSESRFKGSKYMAATDWLKSFLNEVFKAPTLTKNGEERAFRTTVVQAQVQSKTLNCRRSVVSINLLHFKLSFVLAKLWHVLLFDIVCRDEGLSRTVLQYRVKIRGMQGERGLFTQGVPATYGQHWDYTNHWQLQKYHFIFPSFDIWNSDFGDIQLWNTVSNSKKLHDVCVLVSLST